MSSALGINSRFSSRILGVDCRCYLPYEKTKTSIQFKGGHSPCLYLHAQWTLYKSHFRQSTGISGKWCQAKRTRGTSSRTRQVIHLWSSVASCTVICFPHGVVRLVSCNAPNYGILSLGCQPTIRLLQVTQENRCRTRARTYTILHVETLSTFWLGFWLRVERHKDPRLFTYAASVITTLHFSPENPIQRSFSITYHVGQIFRGHHMFDPSWLVDTTPKREPSILLIAIHRNTNAVMATENTQYSVQNLWKLAVLLIR